MKDGPDKTIWGATQKAWLKQTLKQSDADWRIVVSPTPIIGPDRPTKNYNHSNCKGFWTEGQAFLDWLRDESMTNVVLICGDRHWQYQSVDRRKGRLIHEFSCGPTCDQHTQKVVTPNISHDFNGVTQPYATSKGGVLTVDYQPDKILTFTFYDAKGIQLYETVLRPSGQIESESQGLSDQHVLKPGE